MTIVTTDRYYAKGALAFSNTPEEVKEIIKAWKGWRDNRRALLTETIIRAGTLFRVDQSIFGYKSEDLNEKEHKNALKRATKIVRAITKAKDDYIAAWEKENPDISFLDYSTNILNRIPATQVMLCGE